jgi:integrase
MFDRDVMPVLGTKRAADLTTADLARLHSSMRDRPYMANRVLAALGAFCSWCELHGHRSRHSNPAPDVEPYAEHARERFLSGEEMARLGAALTLAETVGVPPAPSRRRKPKKGKTAKHRPKSADTVRPANPFAIACLRFLLLSGWREAEARTLRWDALDTARGHAILADTKTGRSIRPLGASVFAFLDELPRLEDSPYVFPGAEPGQSIVNLTRTWEAVRLAAKLSDVRLHDLRHTAASVAAAGGLSLPLIGALLGHRNPSTTQKYAHLADDPRRLAADRMAGDVAAALAGTATPVTPLRRGSR